MEASKVPINHSIQRSHSQNAGKIEYFDDRKERKVADWIYSQGSNFDDLGLRLSYWGIMRGLEGHDGHGCPSQMISVESRSQNYQNRSNDGKRSFAVPGYWRCRWFGDEDLERGCC